MGLEELFRQQQAANANGSGSEQSIPLLKALGLGDSKKGTLDVFSADGYLKGTEGLGGLFSKRKWDGIVSEGFKNSGGGGAPEITAPQSWTAKFSGGGNGGVELS